MRVIVKGTIPRVPPFSGCLLCLLGVDWEGVDDIEATYNNSSEWLNDPHDHHFPKGDINSCFLFPGDFGGITKFSGERTHLRVISTQHYLVVEPTHLKPKIFIKMGIFPQGSG